MMLPVMLTFLILLTTSAFESRQHTATSSTKIKLNLPPRKKWSTLPSFINHHQQQQQHHTHNLLRSRLFSTTTTTDKKTPTITTNNEALGAWIPIHSVQHLTNLGPQKIKTMGIDLVVWQNPQTQQWSVLSDICPHRLAPLSQGRIDPLSGCIECPYHGWQFDTNGTLTSLPQQPNNNKVKPNKNKKTNVQSSHPVRIVGDMIWSFLPTSICGESHPISLIPEEYYPPSIVLNEYRSNVTYYVRELPYSADFLLENFMDPAHIPFAHHGLQSDRNVDAVPIEMKVEVRNESHLEVGFVDSSGGGRERIGILSFQRPSLYHFRILRNNTNTMIPALCIYITPVQSGRCRIMIRKFSPSKLLPTWLAHAATNRFLNTDLWLHDIEHRVVHGGDDDDDGTLHEKGDTMKHYKMASTSDVGPSAFRTWWKRYIVPYAPRHTLGPASRDDELMTSLLSRKEQLDPWEYHSKHCSECRSALKMMRRVRSGLVVMVMGSCIFVSRKWPWVGALLGGVGIGLFGFVGKCMTVIEGNRSPSGVGDRSYSAAKD